MTLAKWAQISQIVVNLSLVGVVAGTAVLIGKALQEQNEVLTLHNEYLESISVKDWREQIHALRADYEEKIEKAIQRGETRAAEERDRARIERLSIHQLIAQFGRRNPEQSISDEDMKFYGMLLASPIIALEVTPRETALQELDEPFLGAVMNYLEERDKHNIGIKSNNGVQAIGDKSPQPDP